MRTNAAILLTIALTPVAPAGEGPTIPWSTIDAGGTASSVGPYTLSGTVAQHDAGGPTVDGEYTLTGGFWPGVVPASDRCNPADLAPPYAVLDLADVNTFVSAFLAQDPTADLSGNGLFDLLDVNAFVAAFVTGCP
jgi:hypothetical protein